MSRTSGVTKAAIATLVAALGAAVGAVSSQSAPIAFGGVNGRIVFNDQQGGLALVNPDGTGVVRLARTHATDSIIGASFSPDFTELRLFM